jgi:hypothetical protein
VHYAVVGVMEVAIVAIVFGALSSIFIPLVRAFARRLDGRDGAAKVPSDLAARLQRIETAVDSIAVEVERISEGQRFVTQLMSDRAKPPTIGAGPQ